MSDSRMGIGQHRAPITAPPGSTAVSASPSKIRRPLRRCLMKKRTGYPDGGAWKCPHTTRGASKWNSIERTTHSPQTMGQRRIIKERAIVLTLLNE